MHPLLAFIVGLIVTYILVVAIGQALLQGVSDPGGTRMLSLGFQIGPLCAIVGGIILAIVAHRRRATADQAVAPDGVAAAKPQSPALKAAIIVVAVLVLAYLLARVLFGLP
jgi:hypothetical protein